MTLPPDAAPASLPRCTAGIVFAVPIEADAFEHLARDHRSTHAGGLVFHEAVVADRRVAWCVAGPGREAAARAARLLIDGHRPRMLVSAGFAGGLDPRLRRGDVFRPARVVADPAADAIPLAVVLDADTAGGPAATIVTVDAIVGTAAEKSLLAGRSGAQAVDMETHAVATVARTAGLPAAAVRVISDDAGQNLPHEVARLAKPQSSMRLLGSVIGAIGRRPRAALDLWRLYEHAVVDARTLAAALAELCRSLPA